MQHRASSPPPFCSRSLFFYTANDRKRGVSELAQSLAVFVNLRVLEIRENPGVGGSYLFPYTLFGIATFIHSFSQCILVSLPRVCSTAAASRSDWISSTF